MCRPEPRCKAADRKLLEDSQETRYALADGGLVQDDEEMEAIDRPDSPVFALGAEEATAMTDNPLYGQHEVVNLVENYPRRSTDESMDDKALHEAVN